MAAFWCHVRFENFQFCLVCILRQVSDLNFDSLYFCKSILDKRILKTHSLSSKDEKAGNKTEEAKAEEKKPTKPVTVREPLEMVLQLDDVANTSEDALSTSVKK